jgi:hypothetical protein
MVMGRIALLSEFAERFHKIDVFEPRFVPQEGTTMLRLD